MTEPTNGNKIGHGSLADHAAEPAEFSRLMAHLRRTSPRCTGGDCQQGRHCRTPIACHILEDTDSQPEQQHEDDGLDGARGILAALGIVLGVGFVVWLAIHLLTMGRT